MTSLQINISSKQKNNNFARNNFKNSAKTNGKKFSLFKKRKQKILSPEQLKKRKKRRLIIFIILAILLVGGGISGYFLYINRSKIKSPVVKDITKSVEKVVIPDFKQDKNGYTNVLLIGKDTRAHARGLQNTDTVIVGSYNDESDNGVLISIPRDTWVKYPIDQTYYRRINGVYAYGEKKGEGQGIEMLKTVAREVTGLEIHYWAMVDLAVFVKAVDLVGGLDIDVDRSFTDYYFPKDTDTGYRTISFEKGLQHMDGATALDYARSRKASGPEGSDYARARRQQKVIKAFIAKAIAIENLNLETILELKKTFSESVDYGGVSTKDIRAALARTDRANPDNISTIVLDPNVGGKTLITRADPYITGGAYAIWPALGLNKWSDVQAFITEVIKNPAIHREAPVIYTYNGGKGFNETNLLTKELINDFKWVDITYAGNSYIEDRNGVTIFVTGETPESLRILKDYFTQKEYKVEIARELPGFTQRFGENISIIYGYPLLLDKIETQENTN